MKTITFNFTLLLLLLSLVSCTEEISEEIQNNEVKKGELTEIEKFQDKSIRLVHKMDADLSYIMHKSGNVEQACELDSPLLGFDTDDYDKTDSSYNVDCILDVQELDLYTKGAKFEVQVDEFLCQYVTYTPFRFLQYRPGNTDKKQYNIACDSICAAAQPDLCADLAANQFKTIDTLNNAIGTISDTDDLLVKVNPIFSDAIAVSQPLSCDFDYTDVDSDFDEPNCDEGGVTTFNYTLTGNAEDAVLGEACNLAGAIDSAGIYRNTQLTCETSYTWDTGKCITATAVEAPGAATACATAGFFWVGTDENVGDCVSGTEDTTIQDAVSCGSASGSWIGFCSTPIIGIPSTCIAAGATWSGPYCQSNPDATDRLACIGGGSQDSTCNSLVGDVLDVTSHSSESLCTATGSWEFQASCLDLTGADSIELVETAETELACGGKNSACVAGPGVDLLDDEKFTTERYDNTDTNEFTKEFEVEAPFDKDLRSNMYVANFSRICSDTSTDKSADASFDISTLFSIDGSEVEDLSPYTATSGVLHDSDGDGIDDQNYKAFHPLNGTGYTSRPRLTTYPYYSIKCLDQARDVKAQIRLFIREWDRGFENTNAYLSRLSDINQNTLTDPALMDVSDTLEQSVGSAWNDFYDWDDLFNDVDQNSLLDADGDGDNRDKVFLNNQCSAVELGECFDSTIPATGVAPVPTGDLDQATCEATVGQYWISSDLVFPGNKL